MVNQSPNPSRKLYRYIQVIIVYFYTAEFDTNHTNYMNLMSKCYLISLKSKVLLQNDITQLLKKSDHITPYSHGLILDTILMQWFPYDLLQHYLSIYVGIFFHNYAFLRISPCTPPQFHNHSPRPSSEIQPSYYTCFPSRHTALQMLLADKNIQYNDENLHFCTTYISYPSTEKYSV